MITTPVEQNSTDADDVMFCEGFKRKAGDQTTPCPSYSGGEMVTAADAIKCRTKYGSIEIKKYPWRIVVKDAKGKVLTQTRHLIDNDSTQVKL